MKRISTTMSLVTLVAMVVLGAVSAGSASAHDFSWTGPLPGLVLVLSDNPQVFTAEPSGLAVTCQHFGGHGVGSNTVMTLKTVKIVGKYSKCTAAGNAASVTQAEFVLSAEESVAVVNPIVITVPVANCSIKISSGAVNSNLKTIKFLQLPSDILAHVEVIKITSVGSGGLCGVAGVEKTEGSYTGLLLAFVHGGNLRWT